MKLWLDDIREPWHYRPEDGHQWTWVKTVEEAKEEILKAIAAGTFELASLDHDLGACERCQGQWWSSAYGNPSAMPHCEHFGTGYTLVCWMEETGNWPKEKPKVHSMNPEGRRRMQLVIDKKWRAT